MNKRPLGRGLSALISTDSRQAEGDEIREIEIDLIQPGHQQPRTTFNQAKLDELAQSILASGIIQPLLLRRRGGMYELVAGERRWRAAQIAGLRNVPAIVRDIPDDKLLDLALFGKIQPPDLIPFKEPTPTRNLFNPPALPQSQPAN